MGKKDPLPPGTTRIDGTDGSFTFDGEYLTVTHKWLANAGRGEARFPLGAIAGVEVKNGMVLAAVTVVVPGVVPRKGKKNPLTVNGFVKAEAAVFRDMLLTARAKVDSAPAPDIDFWGATADPEPELESGAPTAASGLVEQLQQLADLHTQGMLTAEEFGIAKAKLLGTRAPGDADDPAW